MQNEKIQLQRIKRLIERQNEKLYVDITELQAEFSPDGNNYKPIKCGETWGQPWETGFFRVKGTIPQELSSKNYGLYFDSEGEACCLDNGTPYQGLTPKLDWYHQAAKFFMPMHDKYAPGDEFALSIDASANNLFGTDKSEYKLRKCTLCTFDEALFQKLMDIGLLLNLAEALPGGTVRRQRIIYGLVKVCDAWNTDPDKVSEILAELLSHPAHSSALTAYSVGQAHLDLAWLWPLKESRRKGGRTFANALRLLEQYPEYIFGASQAQLYQWIKEDYPQLYAQVKERIKQGRWEVQGSSWVEFDTNLISGESIIRQFMYGKRWFEKEFGFAPSCLWLPDCFGFSGNLPQYLKGCGVDWFMTQKLSWNESNTFPHHLFMWEGIDGSRILAHQLPTNDYNFSNNPAAFLETEKRFAESDISDAYLNLFGIGDGGGGPTRNHLEYGIRQQNLEGVSKFRFAKSTEFLEHIRKLDKNSLPVMYEELYLEFHRGTYTTQARMKENNRISERKLGAAEYLCVLAGVPEYPELLHEIWKDTLLLQFHDILPGSSITPVYEDAARISEANHRRLDEFMDNTVQGMGNPATVDGKAFLAINPCNQDLDEWQPLDASLMGMQPCDEAGTPLAWFSNDNQLWVRVQVPAWGSKIISFKDAPTLPQACSDCDALVLENRYLKVSLSSRGSILSIWDKEQGRELLAGESNLLKLWEDEPNNWGAWDINHFYRETTPELPSEAKLNKDLSIRVEGQFQRIVQDLQLGTSILQQSLELRSDERFIRISHKVDWQEHHKMLRTHFYPEVYSGDATFGIQGGVIQRSTKPKNAWEEARFEVPAQRFADLSQADKGCALLCDTKFGYRIVDNEMEINLLRSPADVDPTADIHSHSYSYAFYPHQGD
ncbi:MAG: alpha-mannosidase, partial [Candidatus Cloacimonetes bacterium]|nr:alpha-mannosidase [Candidatus Cloacimonadota bacterium]